MAKNNPFPGQSIEELKNHKEVKITASDVQQALAESDQPTCYVGTDEKIADALRTYAGQRRGITLAKLKVLRWALGDFTPAEQIVLVEHHPKLTVNNPKWPYVTKGNRLTFSDQSDGFLDLCDVAISALKQNNTILAKRYLVSYLLHIYTKIMMGNLPEVSPQYLNTDATPFETWLQVLLSLLPSNSRPTLEDLRRNLVLRNAHEYVRHIVVENHKSRMEFHENPSPEYLLLLADLNNQDAPNVWDTLNPKTEEDVQALVEQLEKGYKEHLLLKAQNVEAYQRAKATPSRRQAGRPKKNIRGILTPTHTRFAHASPLDPP